jgi:purine-nucleoside phosphorylase
MTARAGDAAADPVASAVDAVRSAIGVEPKIGLVLGSGLGAIADELADARRIPFADVPGFAPSAVHGHAGALVAGRLDGVPCIILQGRSHAYEGHDADVLTRPVRTLIGLGIDALIVTNAAGALNPTFRPGHIMVVSDHVNLLWRNPLIGRVREGEERFPDMSAPYDAGLRALARDVAGRERIHLVEGVYVALLGPSYETVAEIRMLRRLGGDAVGMSTVPEVLVARAAGVRVLGLSLITNAAAGMTPGPITHDEVMETGARARDYFASLVRGIVAGIAAGGAAAAGSRK